MAMAYPSCLGYGYVLGLWPRAMARGRCYGLGVRGYGLGARGYGLGVRGYGLGIRGYGFGAMPYGLGAIEVDPGLQDPVLWVQYTNIHRVQKSCGGKGMAWPPSKRERVRG